MVATDELLALLLETGALDAAFEDATDDATEDATDALLVVVPQAAPLITGISALAAPLVPWTPNSMVWLGAILPFQFRLVAE